MKSSSPQVTAMIDRLDVDGDGRVNYGDLVAFVEGGEGAPAAAKRPRFDGDDEGERGGGAHASSASSSYGSSHLSEGLERVRKISKDKWGRQAL